MSSISIFQANLNVFLSLKQSHQCLHMLFVFSLILLQIISFVLFQYCILSKIFHTPRSEVGLASCCLLQPRISWFWYGFDYLIYFHQPTLHTKFYWASRGISSSFDLFSHQFASCFLLFDLVHIENVNGASSISHLLKDNLFYQFGLMNSGYSPNACFSR